MVSFRAGALKPPWVPNLLRSSCRGLGRTSREVHGPTRGLASAGGDVGAGTGCLGKAPRAADGKGRAGAAHGAPTCPRQRQRRPRPPPHTSVQARRDRDGGGVPGLRPR